MRRAERLFRLVNEMRSLGTCRAGDLARRLEVSQRTVYRDIAHLQASGLPIDGEAGVGYVLRPGFDLPSVTFTHDQLDALAVGLALAQSMDDPSLAAAAREVRAKLQAGLDSGEAAERFSRMVAALGGPADLVEHPDKHLDKAPFIVPAPALSSGYANVRDCRAIGLAGNSSTPAPAS